MQLVYWFQADERWHAFNRAGKSLCLGWEMKSLDTLRKCKDEREKGAYCTTCKKLAKRVA